jgi:tetratricopeptide (TPR) repeat protein
MKKILFVAILLLSLMVCLTSPAWADGWDDAKAGIAAANEGNYDKAIRLYTIAIESGELSQENLSKTYNNRGLAWEKKGNYDKAIADYTKATEIDPRYTKAYGNRGVAWEKKGNYDKAIADYTKAIEIDSRYGSAYNSLAWVMATCPEGRYRDGKRAVALAEKSVALEDDVNALDTLAAAYAEAGRFQEAIKTQEKAITKLKQEGGTEALPEFEKHLSSYKAGKPWREKRQ